MSDVELLTIGRVNLDLYAQQHGVEFAAVRGWDAMVGGSPVNVAVAATRLGRTAGVLTAIGEDRVGDWVLHALARAGVDTRHVARKRGPHTSLALRAQVAPDHPLAFYRHDPADIHLTAAETEEATVERAGALLASADALARGSMRAACASVVRRARDAGTVVYLDLDLREANWPDLGTYAATVGGAIDDADVLLGTEEEYAALLGLDLASDRPDALAEIVRERLASGTDRVVVLKQGDRGATAFAGEETLRFPAHPVVAASTIGAGDSFAAGLIAAQLEGLEWAAAGRFASACAAVTVTRFGCSDGFPVREEAMALLERDAQGARQTS